MSEIKSPLISAFDVEADLVELSVKILTSIPALFRVFPTQSAIVLFTVGLCKDVLGLCGVKQLFRSWL